MDITLTYKLKHREPVEKICLSAEQYFDTIEINENYEDDGIAKHDSELNYVLEINPNLRPEQFEFTTIEISGSHKSDFITKTQYYGEESKVIHRKDSSGFELIIQSLKITQNCIVITRMERDSIYTEWKNINLNIGLNYNTEDDSTEKWYSVKDGNYIKAKIIEP